MPTDDRNPRKSAPAQGTPAATDKSEKQAAAHQAVDILHEISTILNCHLDRRAVSICISLIEQGINPEALASVVKELRAEAQDVQTESAPRQR